MKKLLNIILFLALALSCRAQDSEIDSTIKLLQSQVSDLYEENYSLKNETTKLLSFIDSLGLVIEGLEASQPSGSFYADTLFMTVYDSLGERLIISKLGTQLNATVINGDIRTAVFSDTTYPEIYRMKGNVTEFSILEDVYKWRVNITDLNTTLEKRK